MTWPEPTPGLVIRYSYLWQREAQAGQEEGLKDRPCAIVLAIENTPGEMRVYVLPVTHSPPVAAEDAIELPMQTRARLGLDGERSWIVISEANVFVWPGPDLRFLPGQGPASAAYGALPPGLFRIIRDRFVARARQRKARLVPRSE
ncbi:hypothetical protein DWF00_17575 [Bosea caraganae]|uniref:Plasmid maintenance toxin (PemK-like) n=1 Tax=Bosea caraganae TaxID=2763117 RepID=A0A370L7V7_9HYPH|nr:hypothetical protein [Bosea caraganae]RDJ25017.1 hypothetical protein DWF00_17575 [Bosea caraganae]RDJ26127.1 hypothetical protein DWE98_09795 [Bosea caraganae]